VLISVAEPELDHFSGAKSDMAPASTAPAPTLGFKMGRFYKISRPEYFSTFSIHPLIKTNHIQLE
jgi:hypothetical protein